MREFDIAEGNDYNYCHVNGNVVHIEKCRVCLTAEEKIIVKHLEQTISDIFEDVYKRQILNRSAGTITTLSEA